MARKNEIKYILGFNFRAPEIKGNGEFLLNNFLRFWLNKPSGDEKAFIDAWKNEQLITGTKTIERGYIRKGENGKYRYAMGRASDAPKFTKAGKPNPEYRFFWNWTDFSIWDYIKGRDLLKLEGKENKEVSEMEIDDYRNWCIYTDEGIAEYQPHITELCKKGIITDKEKVNGEIKKREKFNPKLKITRAEVAKMIVVGARLPESQKKDVKFWDMNNKKPLTYRCNCQDDEFCKEDTDDYAWSFGCIRDLKYKNAINGFPPNEKQGENLGRFKPGENLTRDGLTKMVMMSFFQDQYAFKDTGEPEETPCSAVELNGFKDLPALPKKAWYCAFIEAAVKCDIYQYKDEKNDTFNNFNGNHFGPGETVTRGEVAIVLNRALRLKESGIKSCLDGLPEEEK